MVTLKKVKAAALLIFPKLPTHLLCQLKQTHAFLQGIEGYNKNAAPQLTMPERGGKVECRVASCRTIANLIALINSNQTRPNQTKPNWNETKLKQTKLKRVESSCNNCQGVARGEGRERERGSHLHCRFLGLFLCPVWQLNYNSRLQVCATPSPKNFISAFRQAGGRAASHG